MTSAVAGSMADLGLLPDEADPDPSSPEAAAPAAQEAAYEFNPEIPDDLDELLNGPEDLDDDEPVAASETYEDADELARKLRSTEKQLAWERDQRLKVSRKAWEAEATKFFPLSDPAEIHADSRRAFLRAAKVRHQRTYTLLKPKLDEIAAIKASAHDTALAEERAAVAGAYGKPTVGVGGPPPTTTKDERLQEARMRRDLRSSVRALIDNGTL